MSHTTEPKPQIPVARRLEDHLLLDTFDVVAQELRHEVYGRCRWSASWAVAQSQAWKHLDECIGCPFCGDFNGGGGTRESIGTEE